ncbi:MAG: hypothetical protein ABL879_02100 [Devosia sp.]
MLTPASMDDWPQAVSAFNGQWELNIGVLTNPDSFAGSATGSFTTPVGPFGLQGDFTLSANGSGKTFSATFHAFARDPSAWMVGITKGIVVTDDAALLALGVEGELYFDQLSLETWAGLAGVTYANPDLDDATGFFFFGDLAYYATPNWRLVGGVSSVLGNNQLHLATEYFLQDQLQVPFSFVADARIGETSSKVTIGIHGYFGGDDPNKSLIDRHRQDNLRLRSLDLWGSTIPVVNDKGPPPVVELVDPEESQSNCESYSGAFWDFGTACNITNVSQSDCEFIVDNFPQDFGDRVWVPNLGPDGECVVPS